MPTSNSVPMAVFGPGSLYVTRNDIAGGTPYNIGFCQDFSYDESAEVKDLYGQNQYALVTARGTIKATGKIKAATVSGLALASVFWGQSFQSGQTLVAQAEAPTAAQVDGFLASQATEALDQPIGSTAIVFAAALSPLPVAGQLLLWAGSSGSNPYSPGTYITSVSGGGTTIHLSSPTIHDIPSGTAAIDFSFSGYYVVNNAATILSDLGVIDPSTGLPLLNISTTAGGNNIIAKGQYAYYSNGVYNVKDTLTAALFTYVYSSSGVGQTLTVMNTAIGTTPSFEIDYVSQLYGVMYYIKFFACVSSKLSMAHKLTDFAMPDIDFAFFANSAGQVFQMSQGTPS